MKILLTGVSGLLGRDVWSVLERDDHDVHAIGRTPVGFVSEERWHACDLSDADLTYQKITRINPDTVVHCAAMSDVDGCERNPDAAYRANALTTRNIALACQRFDAALMYVSTDYVFDGETTSKEGYQENDATGPVNEYGRSKLFGEQVVQELLHKFFIVRTSWLFGAARKSFIDRVIENALQDKVTPCAVDMVSAPTYTVDLAKGMSHLLDKGRYGIYHVANEGFCSRVELAEEVLRSHRMAPAGLLKSMKQSELNLPARRPAFSGLQNWMWRLEGWTQRRTWKDALKAYFESKQSTETSR